MASFTAAVGPEVHEEQFGIFVEHALCNAVTLVVPLAYLTAPIEGVGSGGDSRPSGAVPTSVLTAPLIRWSLPS
jgi:hypothetical protein